MEERFDPQRLQKWLEDVASTQDDEVDCDALSAALEQIVAIAEAGEDIRDLMPAVAVHLDHCPECGEWWYEVLIAYMRDQDT